MLHAVWKPSNLLGSRWPGRIVYPDEQRRLRVIIIIIITDQWRVQEMNPRDHVVKRCPAACPTLLLLLQSMLLTPKLPQELRPHTLFDFVISDPFHPIPAPQTDRCTYRTQDHSSTPPPRSPSHLQQLLPSLDSGLKQCLERF